MFFCSSVPEKRKQKKDKQERRPRRAKKGSYLSADRSLGTEISFLLPKRKQGYREKIQTHIRVDILRYARTLPLSLSDTHTPMTRYILVTKLTSLLLPAFSKKMCAAVLHLRDSSHKFPSQEAEQSLSLIERILVLKQRSRSRAFS